MRNLKMTILSMVIVLGSAGQTHAVITAFTNRVAWNINIGWLPDFDIDFDSCLVDTPFRLTAFDAGPFSLQQVGTESSILNIIDAPPLDGSFAINGTTYAQMRVEGDKHITVDMTFDEPILAWGADFRTPIQGGGIEEVDIELLFSDTTTETLQLVPNSFNGFVAMPSEEVISITFMARIADGSILKGENFSMDNVTGVTVPEPATLLLLGLGAMALRRRKR